MKPQYCNHHKTTNLCQKDAEEEAVQNASTLSAEAEYAFNKGRRKRLPFLISLITKNSQDEQQKKPFKFHHGASATTECL